jgi:hypothetical protein
LSGKVAPALAPESFKIIERKEKKSLTVKSVENMIENIF